jgi:hypothetical protein
MDLVSSVFEIETSGCRFSLTIVERESGPRFIGEYFGVSPKYVGGKIIEVGSGRLESADADALVELCISAITRIDGPIDKITRLAGPPREAQRS